MLNLKEYLNSPTTSELNMTAQPIYNNDLNKVRELIAKNIADNQINIPMLPEVAGKVVQLTQDSDSDASQLSSLIQSDQPLAAHVMRVANSAAYSPNTSIVSLQQAIARLGMNLISEIALAASITSEMFNAPGFESHIEYQLKYSLASGLWSKEVARACRKNVEAAFLAGLLHDIGRPVTVQCAISNARKLSIELNYDDIMTLEQEFQREIGIKVVQLWEMPKAVQHAVIHFDEYSVAHESQAQTMVIVGGSKFANHFLCETDDGSCLTKDELLKQVVLADLNLYEDEILEILEKEGQVASAMEAMNS